MTQSEPSFFTAHRRAAPWIVRSAWPCAWVCGEAVAPTVGAYRLRFYTTDAGRHRLIVTADERYRLYLDGHLLRSGPELGTRWRWQADAIDVDLSPGDHLLLAVVWSVGAANGDFATDGIAHGFALGVDGPANDHLATGTAAWEWHALPGYTFRKSPLAHWTVPDLHRDAATTDWAAESGEGDGWTPVRVISPVHHVADVEIFPARLVEVGTLPPAIHRPWTRAQVRHGQLLPVGSSPAEMPLGNNDPDWSTRVADLVRGGRLEVPAHTVLRAVIDCDDYLTAWPGLAAGGAGAEIGIEWMEALSRSPIADAMLDKANRAEIAGRYARGLGDHLRCEGQVRSWRPLFWRSGRFIVLTVATADTPAVLTGFTLMEDRYPLEQEARLDIAHAGLSRALPLCLRTLQVNAHDQFSDTPYYERMQYLGDCRIDCLNAYVLTRDCHLAVKALRMADAQRMPDGLTVSRTPTRNLQVIPIFSLFYVGMVRDHLWWRGDQDLVRSLMPGVRGILDAFLRHRRDDGTIGFMEGWQAWDWARQFTYAEPPGNADGCSQTNFLFLMALGWAEELETALGEPELAARWNRLHRAAAPAVAKAFWSPEGRAWADDRQHTAFSQHAQALAMLAPGLPEEQCRLALKRMSDDPSLTRASLYFTHYLIEAWTRAGDGRSIVDAFSFWAALPDQGFVTLPEAPEPARSDCHAWCAHPLFHSAATIAGIRPAAPGFARVRIAPCPGPIPHLNVRIPHPGGGWIAADLHFDGKFLSGSIELPEGIDGLLTWEGIEHPLRPGRSTF